MTRINPPPWQIFTFIFLLSYLIIKTINTTFMTLVTSVLYGCAMEVVSKYLYVWSGGYVKAEEAGGQDDGLRPGVEEDTDEELEERYANIEVNFDESETEEDDYVPRTIKLRNMEKEVVEEQSEEEFPDEFLLYETREYEEVPVTVSRGKSFIQDDIDTDTVSGNKLDNSHWHWSGHYHNTNIAGLNEEEEVNIDLDDPTVKAAATKIQSVFKGFRTRKSILQEHGYKCG